MLPAASGPISPRPKILDVIIQSRIPQGRAAAEQLEALAQTTGRSHATTSASNRSGRVWVAPCPDHPAFLILPQVFPSVPTLRFQRLSDTLAPVPLRIWGRSGRDRSVLWLNRGSPLSQAIVLAAQLKRVDCRLPATLFSDTPFKRRQERTTFARLLRSATVQPHRYLLPPLTQSDLVLPTIPRSLESLGIRVQLPAHGSHADIPTWCSGLVASAPAFMANPAPTSTGSSYANVHAMSLRGMALSLFLDRAARRYALAGPSTQRTCHTIPKPGVVYLPDAKAPAQSTKRYMPSFSMTSWGSPNTSAPILHRPRVPLAPRLDRRLDGVRGPLDVHHHWTLPKSSAPFLLPQASFVSNSMTSAAGSGTRWRVPQAPGVPPQRLHTGATLHTGSSTVVHLAVLLFSSYGPWLVSILAQLGSGSGPHS